MYKYNYKNEIMENKNIKTKLYFATSNADPDVYPGSRIRIFPHPGSRIQPKKRRYNFFLSV